MGARSPTYPEQQRLNPYRKSTWRWDRACELVETGRYFSRVRDDKATGIAVGYLREIRRCCSRLRLRRIRKQYRHLVHAREIWEAEGAARLEIESRVLAKQSDVAIALAMGLPPETTQAYCDLFFDVRDRLHATGYVQWQLIRVPLEGTCTPVQLMQLAAFFHGPEVITPWLDFLRDEEHRTDLTSEQGRVAASIAMLVSAHSLAGDVETRQSLVKRSPFLLQNDRKSVRSVPAASAFRCSTVEITKSLELPAAELEPCSYLAAGKGSPTSPSRQQGRRVA